MRNFRFLKNQLFQDIFKDESHKWLTVFLLSIAYMLFFVATAKGQFAPRANWQGPFEIKMVSSSNLQPVYLDPDDAVSNRLLADSIVSNATLQRVGKLLSFNNDYKNGSPFTNFSIPVSALKCTDPESACLAGQLPRPDGNGCSPRYDGPEYTNAYIAMTYSDYDTDMSTFSSSMAKLDISSCSEIEAAYLYWSGNFSTGNNAFSMVSGPLNTYSGNGSNVFTVTNTPGTFDRVLLKKPGGAYVTVNAIDNEVDGNTYVCVADVTTLLQGAGGGEYWVANLRSYPIESNGGSTSGWTLVVVFRSPLSPPSRIALWDGYQIINSGGTLPLTLTGFTAPAAGNFDAYVGIAALDGEDRAADLSGPGTGQTLGFSAGNGNYNLDPFSIRPYHTYTDKGYPATCDGSANINSSCKAPLYDAAWCLSYDGILSSQISSYDPATNTNGNQIDRKPSIINTLGYDAHHLKLPAGAVRHGATSATLTIRGTTNGSTMPFMAYIAVELQQPKLELTKTVDKTTTGLETELTYTIMVKNTGNAATLGNDKILDTLDIATDYVPGSLTSRRFVNGAVSGTNVVTLAYTNDSLAFNIPGTIQASDSIELKFRVRVKDFANNQDLWINQCKRTIMNVAYAKYAIAAGGTLESRSNSNDCGIGSETKVLVIDDDIPMSNATVLGPFDACGYMSDDALPRIQSVLTSQGGIPPSVLSQFDIRDEVYERVRPDDPLYVSGGNEPDRIFRAIRDYNNSGNCQQIFEIKFVCSALPVELASFAGWKEGGINVLFWTTATENNNSYFVIERSGNGSEFSAIGTVQGSGNSSHTNAYRFEDEQPLKGINYYRLRQVDYDGGANYSKVISVRSESSELDIYPNPNDGKFTVRILAADQSYRLDITDLAGKLVYSNLGTSVPETIEVNGLAKGVYLVRFQLDQEEIIKKMLVY